MSEKWIDITLYLQKWMMKSNIKVFQFMRERVTLKQFYICLNYRSVGGQHKDTFIVAKDMKGLRNFSINILSLEELLMYGIQKN